MQFLSLLAVLAAFAASATAAPTPEQGTEGNVHVAVAREVVKHHYTINLGQGVVTTADVSGSVGADLVAGAPAYHGFEFELGPTKERLSCWLKGTPTAPATFDLNDLPIAGAGGYFPKPKSEGGGVVFDCLNFAKIMDRPRTYA